MAATITVVCNDFHALASTLGTTAIDDSIIIDIYRLLRAEESSYTSLHVTLRLRQKKWKTKGIWAGHFIKRRFDTIISRFPVLAFRNDEPTSTSEDNVETRCSDATNEINSSKTVAKQHQPFLYGHDTADDIKSKTFFNRMLQRRAST